jgi:hypothetical protein
MPGVGVHIGAYTHASSPSGAQIVSGSGSGFVAKTSTVDGRTRGNAPEQRKTMALSGLQPLTTYHFYAVAKDTAGNHSDVMYLSAYTTPDRTEPAISSLAASAMPGQATSASVEWLCSDAGPVTLTAALYESASAPTPGEVLGAGGAGFLQRSVYGSDARTSGSARKSIAFVGLSPSEPYHVYVVASDASGNTSATPAYTSFTLPDSTAPAITSLSVSGSTQATASVQWSVSDDSRSGPVSVAVGAYSSASSPTASEVAGGTGSGFVSSVTDPDGRGSAGAVVSGLSPATTYHLYAVATDAAGNRSPVAYAMASTSDVTAPAISGVTWASTTDDTVSATFTCDDNSPGTSPVEVYMKAFATASATPTLSQLASSSAAPGEVAAARVYAADGRGTLTLTTPPVLESYRSYSFYLVAVDSHGNAAAAYQQVRVRDSQAPVLSELSVRSMGETTATLEFSLSDNSAGPLRVAVKAYDGASNPATPPAGAFMDSNYSAALDDARTVDASPANRKTIVVPGLSPLTDYHFYVVASDAAGNHTPVQSVAGATSDSSAPELSSVSLVPADTSLLLGWLCSDSAPVALTAAVYSTAASPTEAEVLSTGGVGFVSRYAYGADARTSGGSAKSLLLSGLAPSTAYHVYVVAADAYGNSSGVPLHVAGSTSFDATPPTIASLSASAASDTSIAVTWAASDNSPVGSLQVAAGVYPWASSPSADDIFVGAGAVATGLALDGRGAQATTVEGLSPNTIYHVYVAARDAGGNSSAVSYVAVATTDTAAPVLSQVSWAADEFQVVASLTCADNGGAAAVYLSAYARGSPTPSAAQVVAGSGTGFVSRGTNPDCRGASSVAVSGLAAYTMYDMYLVAADASGNVGVPSYHLVTSGDATAPELALSFESATDTQASLSLLCTDNSPAVAANPVAVHIAAYTSAAAPDADAVIAGTGAASVALVASARTSGAAMAATVPGLSALTEYHFYAVAVDPAGNRSAAVHAAGSTVDTEAPQLSSVLASEPGQTSLLVSWLCSDASPVTLTAGLYSSASAPTAEQVEGPGPGGVGFLGRALYGGDARTAGSTAKWHRFEALESRTTFHVYVVARDSSGNATGPVYVSGATLPDTTAPVLSALDAPPSTIGEDSIGVTWTVEDNSPSGAVALHVGAYSSASGPSAAQVAGGTGAGFVSKAYAPSARGSGSAVVSGLQANTAYYLYATAVDADGNPSSVGLITRQTRDATAPALSGVAWSLGETQATAAFTCSDNSPATQPLSVYMAAYSSSAPTPTPAEVIAGVGTGIVAHAANTDARGASSVSVSGLSEYTEYALYLVAVDSAGQIGASEYRRSLTADTVAPTLDAVITSATETEITFSYTATDNSPG